MNPVFVTMDIAFKKAADDGNYKIISLSQHCIPLKSFDYIYNFLTQDNLCRFNIVPKQSIEPS